MPGPGLLGARMLHRGGAGVILSSILLGAVFEDREVFLREIGDVTALRIGHRHVERDDFDAGPEHLRLFLGRRGLTRRPSA